MADSLSSKLIEGAYRAATAGQATRLAMNNQINDSLAQMWKSSKNAIDSRKKALDETVQKVLASAGDLPTEEYEALYDKLQEGRGQFIFGNNKNRALAISDLNKKAKDYSEYKDVRLQLSEAVANGDLMTGFEESEKGMQLMGLLEDGAKLVEKTCGEGVKCPDKGRMGVMIQDSEKVAEAEEEMEFVHAELDRIAQDAEVDEFGNPMYTPEQQVELEELDRLAIELQGTIDNGGEEWVSVSNIGSMIETKNTTAAENISTLGNALLNESENVGIGDAEFNREKIARKVESEIIGDGDLKSLVYDRMIDGRPSSFFEDTVSFIQDNTWEDLGVAIEEGTTTDQQLTEYAKFIGIDGQEIDSFDGLDEEEKQIIMETYAERQERGMRKKAEAEEYVKNNPVSGVNVTDGISREEAELITKAMTEDPLYKDILKKELTNYFTEFMSNQWEAGKAGRKQQVVKNTETGALEVYNEPIEVTEDNL